VLTLLMEFNGMKEIVWSFFPLWVSCFALWSAVVLLTTYFKW
jgi:hypothetical protein